MSEEIKTTIDKQMFGMDMNTLKAFAVLVAAVVYGYTDFKGRIERLEQAPVAVKVLETKQNETDKSISEMKLQMKQIQDSFTKTSQTLDEIRNTTEVIQQRLSSVMQQQAANAIKNQDQNSFQPAPRR